MASKKCSVVSSDDIVISGISGKFPESSNIEEFKQNLLNGVDMVNNDPRRWEAGFFGLPDRMAKLKNEDLEKFDNKFFGVHQMQVELMDPCMRMLLELTQEAIIDAGLNPTTLRGSRTGVYVGISFVETEHEIPAMEPSRINGYCLTGCARAMFANRISFTFDFKGPSFVVDTACSSSMVGFSHAFTDIREGRCDYAIVAGVNLILRPIFALQFLRLGIISKDGASKTFDSAANGYARADSCALVLLQRSTNAKRIYATILNACTNTDGFKVQGVTFPSGHMQYKLLEKTYGEINLSPNYVVYVEAHGSGTPVGDQQEGNMLSDFFCKDRDEPLLIGSVKSNMGHAEAASGISALAKVIIAMEEGIIPGNLHYKHANPNVQGLLDGRIKVVDRNTPWLGGIIGLNSFGFGGANAHIILKSHSKENNKDTNAKESPKLVICSGRTSQAVNTLLGYAIHHRDNNELISLINDIHSKVIPLHNFRGYAVLDRVEGVLKQEVLEYNTDNSAYRPIWFVYAGMGSQWASMARDLMQIDSFNKSIKNCAEILNKVDIDLIDILINSTEQTFDNMLYSFISIAAVQVALTDLLKKLDIKPDGIIGHSAGELGAAYMDGCLTAEQTILSAYWRGKSVLETPNLPKGKMAAVGLSWEEIQKRLPNDCYPVCHNSADNCTVSGPTDSMDAIIEQLTAQCIFTRVIESGGYAFHSKYIEDAVPMLKRNLNHIISNPKNRSKHWLSTSVPEAYWHTPEAEIANANYFINNLISPVYFYEAIQCIPKNAIIVEIAPHGLFGSILRTLGPDITYVSLMKRKHKNNAEFLLSNLGKFYAAGGQPQILNISAPVSYPVARGTPMLNSVIGWDHSQKWPYPKFKSGQQSGQTILEIDLNKKEDAFLIGHTIDGRILIPATGYITIVWMSLAKQHGLDFLKTPIILEDIVFHRATILNHDAVVKLGINFFQGNGTFEICEGISLVVSGKIHILDNIEKEQLVLKPLSMSTVGKPLLTKDIYKELRLRGYEYNGIFQGLIDSDAIASTGHLQWLDNWISFMDTMLQFRILSNESRGLYVPTRIERIVINPIQHLELINKLSQSQQIELGLPVYWYKNISVIKSGGVEIHKVKITQTQRRPLPQSKPNLERYTFVANRNIENNPLKNDKKSQVNALTIALQIIIENADGALKIKGVELDRGHNIDSLVAPKLLKLIEREPILVADIAVTTPNKDNFESVAALLCDAGVRTINKDIKTEPVEQNCHFVYGADVCLFTRSEPRIMENIMSTIKNNGFLILEEHRNSYRRNAHDLLARHNLGIILEKPYGDNRVLAVLRRTIKLTERNLTTVHITEENFSWLNELKHKLTKSLSANGYVYLVCEGEQLFGAVGLMTCLRREHGGNNARLVYIQDEGVEEFSFNSNFYKKQLELDLAFNILKKGIWGTYRHLALNEEMPMLQVEKAYINALTKGDLASLKWIESPRTSLSKNTEFENCTVYYAPLNFRDIMLASGKLSADALPGHLAQQDCILGLEFAGRDSSGRRVMAMVPSKALATNCFANKCLLWQIPDNWSMEQAATVPCVYATVYYALVVRGQMKPGEKILIHAGSGGVGQAAISVALHHGLTVFTTVGSQEKREFLKQRFPKLQDRYIGNSRDTTFEQLVMSETNGDGVDLVLNSLAEEKLQASVRCLGTNGRFLEIGKFDLSNNNSLGMSLFLKNTSFHGILLDSVMESDESMQKLIAALVDDGIRNGAVIPLPTTIYTDEQVEQAFRFMASGKHIGKVVIKMRDEEMETKTLLPKPKLINAIPRTYMHPQKSYLLVGGLGGFGLELANWMVTRGACYLVLNSRTGVKSGYQSLMIRRWQERAVHVVIDTNDVTTAEGCKRLLNQSSKLAPVGGIFNLAALLRDGVLEDQSIQDFETVTAPKVLATRFLDQYSRTVCSQLDYFVCFSSASSGRGNAGQTNYGLANSTMERICEQRQINGFPGMAIQWGAIGDTGLVMESIGNNNTVVGGTLPQRMKSCLEIFDLFLQQPYPVLASMIVAEKRKNEQSNKISLIATIANIMGLHDVKDIPDKSTLFDYGIDSLMSTEVKQTLERHFDLILTAQEIRQLTFGTLKQIESDADSKQIAKNDSNVIQSNKSKVIFTNEVLPKEVLVRLKSKAEPTTKKRPVFFLASIEGFVKTLETLAERLDCPVYGLQCNEQVPLDSIEACANFYLTEITNIQSKGPYNIVGYSFGCLLAHAIGLQLEHRSECAKILMLDGAPNFAASYVQTARKQTDDVNRQQAMALAYFGVMLADVDYNNMLNQLTALPTWEQKLAQLAEILAVSTKQSKEKIKKAACMFKQKLLLSESYNSTLKLQSDVILIKSEENNAIMTEDYGLEKICNKIVDIKVVAGSHRTFLQNTQSLQIIEQTLNTLI